MGLKINQLLTRVGVDRTLLLHVVSVGVRRFNDQKNILLASFFGVLK